MPGHQDLELGNRGTCGATMGWPAVKYILLLGATMLGGCSLAPAAAGVAAGGTAAALSANPVVGYAVGLGVRAGADEVLKYYVRVRKNAEQDAIASVAGEAALGSSHRWEIRHTIPIGNTKGSLSVIAEISNPLTKCREVAFRPDGTDSPFITQVCRDGDHWHWAAAEPAVERWGNLQ
jgi:hypothetical protein